MKSSVSVARYLVARAKEQGRTLSPMKLVKLVYMAHGWMLGIYGRPLIEDTVEAWQYGPVIPDLYEQVKRFGEQPVVLQHLHQAEDPEGFDHTEQSIMDQVHDIYGKYPAMTLSAMTHARGTPWKKVHGKRRVGAVISNDLIEQHYYDLYIEHGKKNEKETTAHSPA